MHSLTCEVHINSQTCPQTKTNKWADCQWDPGRHAAQAPLLLILAPLLLLILLLLLLLFPLLKPSIHPPTVLLALYPVVVQGEHTLDKSPVHYRTHTIHHTVTPKDNFRVPNRSNRICFWTALETHMETWRTYKLLTFIVIYNYRNHDRESIIGIIQNWFLYRL